MGKLTIYINKDDDGWLKELRNYAKNNHWSISLAIRELLSKYFEVKQEILIEEKADIKGFTTNNKSELILEKKPEKFKKLDPDTFFAQVESQVMSKEESTDIKKQVEDCVKSRLDKDGNCSCYFFDNAREYFSFCRQYCWTREDIWHKRVRP